MIKLELTEWEKAILADALDGDDVFSLPPAKAVKYI